MKKDVMAATATVVAIVIMIVAIVAMCAVPAQADERAAAEARFAQDSRNIPAGTPCITPGSGIGICCTP